MRALVALLAMTVFLGILAACGGGGGAPPAVNVTPAVTSAPSPTASAGYDSDYGY